MWKPYEEFVQMAWQHTTTNSPMTTSCGSYRRQRQAGNEAQLTGNMHSAKCTKSKRRRVNAISSEYLREALDLMCLVIRWLVMPLALLKETDFCTRQRSAAGGGWQLAVCESEWFEGCLTFTPSASLPSERGHCFSGRRVNVNRELYLVHGSPPRVTGEMQRLRWR